MKKRTKCVLLYNYFRELIDRKRHAKKYSTADLYCATTNWIKKFVGTQLPLNKVTPGMIDRFHAFLLSQKTLKNNSIISYLHNFRAMYNTAIREHLIRPPYISPFTHLSLRKENSQTSRLARNIRKDLPTELTRRIRLVVHRRLVCLLLPGLRDCIHRPCQPEQAKYHRRRNRL